MASPVFPLTVQQHPSKVAIISEDTEILQGRIHFKLVEIKKAITDRLDMQNNQLGYIVSLLEDTKD